MAITRAAMTMPLIQWGMGTSIGEPHVSVVGLYSGRPTHSDVSDGTLIRIEAYKRWAG